MTPIWVEILAVSGFELHVNKDTRKLFTLVVNFTAMIGDFSQATLWNWDEERQEYFAGRKDAVAREVGDWGKELQL